MNRLDRALCCMLGLAAAAVGVASPATAATLPAASTFVRCFADGNNSFHSTECRQGGFPGVPPSAFALATLSPMPSLSVEVTAPPAAALGAGADANATYYFQVTGGSVGDTVPILLGFAMNASGTPESTALARLIIRTSLVPFLVEELVCDPRSCEETALADTLSMNVLSGAMLDSVTMYVMVQAPATHISNETAHAFADPYIYVDPAFANASLYNVVVSPGVGNVAAVPEPASAMLWLVGAALVAFSTLKRRFS